MGKRICSIDGCEKAVRTRGWCVTHYRRWHRTGDPCKLLINRHPGTPEERFWAKVEKTETCWNWTGAVNIGGYGNFYVERRNVLAHRFSFALAGNVLPSPSVEVDHRCHNKLCVRPDHLRIATSSQNNENYRPGTVKSNSGVRGVSREPQSGMWRARVQRNGEVLYYRVFESLDEAEIAVVAARNGIHTYNDADRIAR